MSKALDLIFSLFHDASTNKATAISSPALDDNTKKLATTEWALNQFTNVVKQSIGTNGFQVLPGGLIVQWGSVEKPTTAASIQITYPMPFPTGPYTITAGFGGTSNPNGSGVSAAMTSTTKATFFTSSGAAGLYINWIAIGH